MTQPQEPPPLDAECPRCPHPLAEHGAGCTSGHFQSGPVCHCPNDSDGRNVQTCGQVGCVAPGTSVEATGQFFCADHGRRATPINEITGWVEA